MANSLLFLEDMLFRTLSKEIEERHREVLALYSHDLEITNIANSIKRLCDHIFEIYKGIPDPSRKLDESLYSTLFYPLKEINSTV